jgi:hypothetical protein
VEAILRQQLEATRAGLIACLQQLDAAQMLLESLDEPTEDPTLDSALNKIRKVQGTLAPEPLISFGAAQGDDASSSP